MKSKHDYSKKYSVFDKVRMEMPNWTGYNSVLLDELVDIGNELLRDNERLEKEVTTLQNKHVSKVWSTIASYLIILTFLGSIFGGLGAWVFHSSYKEKALALGYKQGQVDVLTEEGIAYESTIHGYKLNPEYAKFQRSEYFTIKDGEKTYMFFLKE